MPFGDEGAFADFQMVHGLSHDRIAAVMYGNSDFYETYPLYNAPNEDPDWLLVHQQEHESIYRLLDLNGLPDLATVDFQNEDEFSDWLLLHQIVHERINAQLGIV